ncbi:hypothetical protein SJ05684_c03090 [Sinorhizobium sojae CCBAU 05684]|uniref:Uncharacterized protein n=1 Tax=Sinorhizobium sojae CCBAU 05684 TaxID=716928 RepID=A0A249P7U1_9HYPH|nr:hypothetical protein SJ05684_c03090 [Sinorhizobium sojae CCBAU 05684]
MFRNKLKRFRARQGERCGAFALCQARVKSSTYRRDLPRFGPAGTVPGIGGAKIPSTAGPAPASY